MRRQPLLWRNVPNQAAVAAPSHVISPVESSQLLLLHPSVAPVCIQDYVQWPRLTGLHLLRVPVQHPSLSSRPLLGQCRRQVVTRAWPTVVEKQCRRKQVLEMILGESLFTAKPTPFFVEKTSSQLTPTLFALVRENSVLVVESTPVNLSLSPENACHVMHCLMSRTQTNAASLWPRGSMIVRSLSH